MNEVDRIRATYERRKWRQKETTYSYFSPGNLFLVHERQRKELALLRRYGCASLREKRVLEIGCGTGGRMRELVLWGARPENLYGVDLIDERIREARQINPGIHYAVGNAERLEFEDKQFDLLLLSTCFTSILEKEMKVHVADEALRVLRDDGIILWYDFRYDNPWNPDVKGIGKRELRELFGNSNFHFTSVTLVPQIARRLAPTSWLTCELLARIPFLRTHYLVVITKRR
jgi:SAM-dependent methyltransferase